MANTKKKSNTAKRNQTNRAQSNRAKINPFAAASNASNASNQQHSSQANNNTSRNNSGNGYKTNETPNYLNFGAFQNQFQNFSNLSNFNPANVQQWMGQLVNTSQRNIEALTACTQIAVERVKELMEEQANFTNRMIQETTATVQESFSGKAEPRDKLEDMADYTKYCMEKTAAHARKAAEDNLQVAQQIGDTLNKRLNDSIDEIRSAA